VARANRPVKAYADWAAKIPGIYHEYVLQESEPFVESVENDQEKIWMLKHYGSLVPLAMQARKPMFDLKPADGVNGSTLQAVERCRQDFRELVAVLAERLEIPTPLL